MTAGLVSTAPSTETRPSAIQRSASRREHSPARASNLAMRSGGAPPPWPSPAGGGGDGWGLVRVMRRGLDKGAEDAAVALVDLEFGMPLHAEAKAPARVLDALDDAVIGERVDDDAGPDRLDRLVMGAVDAQMHRPGRCGAAGSRRRPGRRGRARRAGSAGGAAGAPGTSSGMCWIRRAAERHVQQLLAAADAEHRLVAAERAAGGGELEGGAAVLGGDAGVAGRRAEQRRVDVEAAAGDDRARRSGRDSPPRPRARAAAGSAARRHGAPRCSSSRGSRTTETSTSRPAARDRG